MEETALYRYWNRENTLLYVGITDHMYVRDSQHKKREWFDQVRRYEVEMHPSRKIAEAAELVAIFWEKPIYNILGQVEGFIQEPKSEPVKKKKKRDFYNWEKVAIASKDDLDANDRMIDQAKTMISDFLSIRETVFIKDGAHYQIICRPGKNYPQADLLWNRFWDIYSPWMASQNKHVTALLEGGCFEGNDEKLLIKIDFYCPYESRNKEDYLNICRDRSLRDFSEFLKRTATHQRCKEGIIAI